LNKEREEFGITNCNILNSSGIIDAVYNEFDLTWFNNFGEDKSKWPRSFTHLPFRTEAGEDDGLVSYEYNSNFFRCDEFIKDHKERYHVLFGGCSETEGVGGNLNELWAYNLHSELKQKYDVGGYYSLGRSGNGWHKIALALTTYVKKYGKPTHFFVMLPNIGRNFYWDEKRNGWEYNQKYVKTTERRLVTHRDGSKMAQLMPEENTMDVDEYRRQFMEFAVGWSLLFDYCKTNHINLLYSTWFYGDNNSLKNLEYVSKNFFTMNNEYLFEFIAKRYPRLSVSKKELKKRDGHNGRIVHEYWTSCFMKEIEKRGLFND
jgi:hypothetical protein